MFFEMFDEIFGLSTNSTSSDSNNSSSSSSSSVSQSKDESLVPLMETLQLGEPQSQPDPPQPQPQPQQLPSFKRVSIQKEPEHHNDTTRQIMKELKELNSVNFDEEQIRVDMVGDNPHTLIVTLSPNDGLYKDGEYEIELQLPSDYPHSKPTFHFRSQIYHPNVDYKGKICFSLLDENTLRIADYVHGLLWLLYYPNLWSRLNMDCPRGEKEYAANVRKSIVGGIVAGKTYTRSPKLVRLDENANDKEKQKEEEVNLKTTRDGKCWEWRLVEEEWVQVFA